MTEIDQPDDGDDSIDDVVAGKPPEELREDVADGDASSEGEE